MNTPLTRVVKLKALIASAVSTADAQEPIRESTPSARLGEDRGTMKGTAVGERVYWKSQGGGNSIKKSSDRFDIALIALPGILRCACAGSGQYHPSALARWLDRGRRCSKRNTANSILQQTRLLALASDARINLPSTFPSSYEPNHGVLLARRWPCSMNCPEHRAVNVMCTYRESVGTFWFGGISTLSRMAGLALMSPAAVVLCVH